MVQFNRKPMFITAISADFINDLLSLRKRSRALVSVYHVKSKINLDFNLWSNILNLNQSMPGARINASLASFADELFFRYFYSQITAKLNHSIRTISLTIFFAFNIITGKIHVGFRLLECAVFHQRSS